MYIELQQKINKIMIFLFIVIVGILIGLYLLFTHHLINMITFVLLFIVIIFIYNYLIRFLEQNLEHHTIYKMLKKNQFTLATIQNVEFYKELRDSTFAKQYVYKFHIQIKTLESQIIDTDIYENVKDNQINCLPGDVYVTCDKDYQHISIIPTLMIQMSPEIEPQVRQYEELYETHYIVAIRDKGLSLKAISNVIKEMNHNHV